jgi:hypothetical protein
VQDVAHFPGSGKLATRRGGPAGPDRDAHTGVAGLPAWTVTVRVRDPHAPPAGVCVTMRVNCTPILYLGELVDDPVAGIWGDMVSRFSFVELPEHDSAVVWSWTFGDKSMLNGNQRLIDSIHFQTPDA